MQNFYVISSAVLLDEHHDFYDEELANRIIEITSDEEEVTVRENLAVINTGDSDLDAHPLKDKLGDKFVQYKGTSLGDFQDLDMSVSGVGFTIDEESDLHDIEQQNRALLDFIFTNANISFGNELELNETDKVTIEEDATLNLTVRGVKVSFSIKTMLEANVSEKQLIKLLTIVDVLAKNRKLLSADQELQAMGVTEISDAAEALDIILPEQVVCFEENGEVADFLYNAGFTSVYCDEDKLAAGDTKDLETNFLLTLKDQAWLTDFLNTEANRIEGGYLWAMGTFGLANRTSGATQKARQFHALASAIESLPNANALTLMDTRFNHSELQRKGAIIPFRIKREQISIRDVLDHHRHSISDWLISRDESKSQQHLRTGLGVS